MPPRKSSAYRRTVPAYRQVHAERHNTRRPAAARVSSATKIACDERRSRMLKTRFSASAAHKNVPWKIAPSHRRDRQEPITWGITHENDLNARDRRFPLSPVIAVIADAAKWQHAPINYADGGNGRPNAGEPSSRSSSIDPLYFRKVNVAAPAVAW